MRAVSKTATDLRGVCLEIILAVVLVLPCFTLSVINKNGLALLITAVLIGVSVGSVYMTYTSSAKTVMLLQDRVKIFANGKEERSVAYSKCTLTYNGLGAIIRLKPLSLELTVKEGDTVESYLIPCGKSDRAVFEAYFNERA
jgi:hypothetical protein